MSLTSQTFWWEKTEGERNTIRCPWQECLLLVARWRKSFEKKADELGLLATTTWRRLGMNLDTAAFSCSKNQFECCQLCQKSCNSHGTCTCRPTLYRPHFFNLTELLFFSCLTIGISTFWRRLTIFWRFCLLARMASACPWEVASSARFALITIINILMYHWIADWTVNFPVFVARSLGPQTKETRPFPSHALLLLSR